MTKSAKTTRATARKTAAGRGGRGKKAAAKGSTSA